MSGGFRGPDADTVAPTPSQLAIVAAVLVGLLSLGGATGGAIWLAVVVTWAVVSPPFAVAVGVVLLAATPTLAGPLPADPLTPWLAALTISVVLFGDAVRAPDTGRFRLAFVVGLVTFGGVGIGIHSLASVPAWGSALVICGVVAALTATLRRYHRLTVAAPERADGTDTDVTGSASTATESPPHS